MNMLNSLFFDSFFMMTLVVVLAVIGFLRVANSAVAGLERWVFPPRHLTLRGMRRRSDLPGLPTDE